MPGVGLTLAMPSLRGRSREIADHPELQSDNSLPRKAKMEKKTCTSQNVHIIVASVLLCIFFINTVAFPPRNVTTLCFNDTAWSITL